MWILGCPGGRGWGRGVIRACSPLLSTYRGSRRAGRAGQAWESRWSLGVGYDLDGAGLDCVLGGRLQLCPPPRPDLLLVSVLLRSGLSLSPDATRASLKKGKGGGEAGEGREKGRGETREALVVEVGGPSGGEGLGKPLTGGPRRPSPPGSPLTPASPWGGKEARVGVMPKGSRTSTQGPSALSEDTETLGGRPGLCRLQKPRFTPALVWDLAARLALGGCSGHAQVGVPRVLTGGPGRPLPCKANNRVRVAGDRTVIPPPLTTRQVQGRALRGLGAGEPPHPQRRGPCPESTQDRPGRTADPPAPQTPTRRRDRTHPKPRWPRGPQTSLRKETGCQERAGPSCPSCSQTCSSPNPSHTFFEKGAPLYRGLRPWAWGDLWTPSGLRSLGQEVFQVSCRRGH